MPACLQNIPCNHGADMLIEYSKFRCFEFLTTCRQVQEVYVWQHHVRLQLEPDHHLWNPNFQIIYKMQFFFNSEVCATYDEVKLTAKRGGLVYVTPETYISQKDKCWRNSPHTWVLTKSICNIRNSHFQHSRVPVFFFSTLKRFRGHVNIDKVMRNLIAPG